MDAQTYLEASQIDFICGLAHLPILIMILIQYLLVLHHSSGSDLEAQIIQTDQLSFLLLRSYFLIADENSQQVLLPLIAR